VNNGVLADLPPLPLSPPPSGRRDRLGRPPPRARQLSESSNHQLIHSYGREVSPFTAGRYYPSWPFFTPFRDHSAFEGTSRRSIRRKSHF
jgi:hypothetical protein